MSANDSPNANTIAFCEDCAREISHILNVSMNVDISPDGTISCPHCKMVLGFDDDIGYFCCEFCGQKLRG
nr:MAG TPA: putative cytoplasmic protein [Caudoviricetes sp.]